VSSRRQNLDAKFDQFARRLPAWASRFVRWLGGPSARPFRIPLGLVLIAGGIVGFLPILGFWMVPLGLLVVARDVPFLETPTTRLLDWINRKWPRRNASRGS
jgi:hypothetical protein